MSVEIKSKFDSEFRRFSLKTENIENFCSFLSIISNLHKLKNIQFSILYIDPLDNDLLPINNDDNYVRALKTAKPLLKIIVQRKIERFLTNFGGNNTGTLKTKSLISNFLGQTPVKAKGPIISNPHDFRQVSQIIDVDIVPDTCRRVRLLKHGTEKPLGFYIRDGTSVRVTSTGLEKLPGIFISRLVPGGLAESTGLLAVNDEILEVNGIEVAGKTLDQVTDMMVANSTNLIITVKPANQRSMTLTRKNSFTKSNLQQSTDDIHNAEEAENDDHEDDIIDLVNTTTLENTTNLSDNNNILYG